MQQKNKIKGFKYRDSSSLMYTMLKMLSVKDCSSYELSRYCFVPSKKTKEMLKEFESRGVIISNEKFYKLSRKGFRIVELLENMKDMIKSDDKMFYFIDPIEKTSRLWQS
jgi:predicted transcriptional regulator